jgi:hypothetical protein
MGAYDGMSDQDLIDLARRIMAAAVDEPIGSIERAMKWAGYDSVMNELTRRLAKSINEGLGLPDVDL